MWGKKTLLKWKKKKGLKFQQGLFQEAQSINNAVMKCNNTVSEYHLTRSVQESDLFGSWRHLSFWPVSVLQLPSKLSSSCAFLIKCFPTLNLQPGVSAAVSWVSKILMETAPFAVAWSSFLHKVQMPTCEADLGLNPLNPFRLIQDICIPWTNLTLFQHITILIKSWLQFVLISDFYICIIEKSDLQFSFEVLEMENEMRSSS